VTDRVALSNKSNAIRTQAREITGSNQLLSK